MVESTYAFNFHGPDHLKGVYFEYQIYQKQQKVYLWEKKPRKAWIINSINDFVWLFLLILIFKLCNR